MTASFATATDYRNIASLSGGHVTIQGRTCCARSGETFKLMGVAQDSGLTSVVLRTSRIEHIDVIDLLRRFGGPRQQPSQEDPHR